MPHNPESAPIAVMPKPTAAGKKRRYYRHWLTLAVLFITSCTSYQVWRIADQNLDRERQLYFEFRVRQLINSIEQRLQTYEQVLYGVRGLFAASGIVERAEYREYVASLNLDQHFPGIQGLGFSLLIPKAEKDRHIAEMRRQGFPDYAINPPGERDVYTSIIYLEPFTGRNLRAFSYDMFSEPTRNKAMIYARDNNSLGISGKLKLLQETEQDVQAGFIMYLPVYTKNAPHNTLEQRRANVVGWVYAPFRSKDLMTGIGGERESDLGLEIFDGEQMTEEQRMYGTPPEPGRLPVLRWHQQIIVANHPWILSIHTEPDFHSQVGQDKPLLIGIGGISLSLLLSFLTWELVNGRSRAQSLAEAMTSELRESESRFRAMANSAPVLIWLAGTDKQCYWFNKVWLDFTGRTVDQEFGSGWAQGVHPDDLNFCLQQYTQHFDQRHPFRIEYRLKRHDGEYRWLLDSGIPRYADNGEFVGYIGSCIDITEPKQVMLDLQNSNADLSRFSEISAHHLMEPARRFASFTQRLRHALAAYPDVCANDDINTSLKYLEQDALRLKALVRDIQRYIAANQARDKITLTPASQAVATVLQNLADKIAAAGALIKVGELPSAYIDQPRLMELFSLCIDNALVHAHNPDSELPLQIEISGVCEPGLSRYYVGDNGSGINPEYQKRVFEIFERLHYRDSLACTGIGLSIARRIVTSCRGNIWIENNTQGGTVIVFELPNIEISNRDA